MTRDTEDTKDSKGTKDTKEAGNRSDDNGATRGGKVNPIELQRALKGADYPASREDLVAKARDAGADDAIIGALGSMADRQYEDPAQVSEAVAKA
jgi:hypothetical protein